MSTDDGSHRTSWALVSSTPMSVHIASIFSFLNKILSVCFEHYVFSGCKPPILVDFLENFHLSQRKTSACLNKNLKSPCRVWLLQFPILPESHMFQIENACSIWMPERKGTRSKTPANPQLQGHGSEKCIIVMFHWELGAIQQRRKAQEKLTQTGNHICRLKCSFQQLIQFPSNAYQEIRLASSHRKHKEREGGTERRTEGERKGGRQREEKMPLPLLHVKWILGPSFFIADSYQFQ